MTINCAFPGCKATHPGSSARMMPPADWAWIEHPSLPSGWYCRTHADAIDDEQRLGQRQWCESEPAVVDLGEAGRLCHACHTADAEEWQARRDLASRSAR